MKLWWICVILSGLLAFDSASTVDGFSFQSLSLADVNSLLPSFDSIPSRLSLDEMSNRFQALQDGSFTSACEATILQFSRFSQDCSFGSENPFESLNSTQALDDFCLSSNNCPERARAVFSNIRQECGGFLFDQTGFDSIISGIASIYEVFCLREDSEYCILRYQQLSSSFASMENDTALTASSLEQLCSPCIPRIVNRIIQAFGLDNSDGESITSTLGQICLRRSNKWCYLEFQRFIDNQDDGEADRFGPVCEPCFKASIGHMDGLTEFDRFNVLERIDQICRAGDSDGDSCVQHLARFVDGVLVECPQSNKSLTSCSNACQQEFESAYAEAGCCSQPITDLFSIFDQDPISLTTFAQTQCNLASPPSCTAPSPLGSIIVVLIIDNLDTSYFGDHEQQVCVAVAQDVARWLGISPRSIVCQGTRQTFQTLSSDQGSTLQLTIDDDGSVEQSLQDSSSLILSSTERAVPDSGKVDVLAGLEPSQVGISAESRSNAVAAPSWIVLAALGTVLALWMY
jgi:hypothetical protein